jgi:hypothetical protein
MNELSWLIYLADVSHSIGNMCAAVLVFGGFTGFCLSIGFAAASAYDDEDTRKPFVKALKWLGAAILVAGIISAIAPSRNTVYAIAASEMGERALETETATKAFKALDAWLDRQLGETPDDAPAAD